MSWRVFLTPTAIRMLETIRSADASAHGRIPDKIRGLQSSPEKQGRALLGPLKGLRRIVAAGRYRVIYRVIKNAVTVHVLAAGTRKEGDKRDIYEIARKLIRAKLV